jgi:formyltetrahydrofolate deformylase
MKLRKYILSISCPDRVGIVAGVSGLISSFDGSIIEASYHADPDKGWFFMRTEILAESLPFGLEGFKEAFSPVAQRFGMDWKVSDTGVKKRVAILVSKEEHCLSDLLHRWRSGEMEFELTCVVSNHDVLRRYVEWHNVPYHTVPIDKEKKAHGFHLTEGLLKEMNPELVILARYMQVLPGEMCHRWLGKIINIHHGFLPSFMGARPYHQAYERGVKLIGATSHYVTEDLDNGPIIEQDVIRVDHGDSTDDLIRLGRDVEKNVLARAVRWALEDRILVHGRKTVVFK